MKENIFEKFLFLVSVNLILLSVYLIPGFIFADEEIIPTSTPIHLTITSGQTSLYDNDISVTACDSDNDISTPDTITAYCAILQSQLSSEWDWSWAPGAFVKSIENIAGYTSVDSEGNNVYHYWSWSSNGTLGMTGLNQYELQNSDVILLEFIDPVEEESNNNGGGGGSGSTPSFSIPNAISFLLANQNPDGSFSIDMYTDWVAIASSAGSFYDNELKSKIYNYLINHIFESSVITDYERHAMALMSLGINPYNGTDIDYIKKITDSFDGEQIGDDSLVNDDIFGVLVLSKAGFDKDEDVISKSVSFIISKQSNNGSFGSIDMTAAFIQATKELGNISGLSDAIEKAKNYLAENQESDGGFGNIYSTSWVTQAFSMSNNSNNQILDAKKYLAENQESDGGVGDLSNNLDSRIWATSYTIPAVLQLSWIDILESFDKNEITEEVSVTEDKEEIKITNEQKIDEVVVSDIPHVIKKEVIPKVLSETSIVVDDSLNNEKVGTELSASVIGTDNFVNLSGRSLIYLIIIFLGIILGMFIFKRKI